MKFNTISFWCAVIILVSTIVFFTVWGDDKPKMEGDMYTGTGLITYDKGEEPGSGGSDYVPPNDTAVMTPSNAYYYSAADAQLLEQIQMGREDGAQLYKAAVHRWGKANGVKFDLVAIDSAAAILMEQYKIK